jgi:hypothetical protein
MTLCACGCGGEVITPGRTYKSGHHPHPVRSPIERFLRYVNKTTDSNGCWLWKGGKQSNRNVHCFYGRFCLDTPSRLMVYAHRAAYEFWVGPIPEGLVIDHLCRNTLCVNPGHLEAVTDGENILRGVGGSARNSRKRFCKRGHPFDRTEIKNGKLHRRCSICKSITWQQWAARNRRVTARAS